MATYPTTLRISPSSERALKADRELERATNGALRGRMFYTSPKSVFQVEHDSLTSAEQTTFDAFYAANMNISFSFVWPQDGVTYTVLFGSREPSYKPMGANRVSITFEVEQV